MPFVVAPLFHEVLRTGKPYPIKSAYFAGANPLNMQSARSVWQSCKNNLDLLVVADFFPVPVAEIADYVLPATTWLERDGVGGYDSNVSHVSARQRV